MLFNEVVKFGFRINYFKRSEVKKMTGMCRCFEIIFSAAATFLVGERRIQNNEFLET